MAQASKRKRREQRARRENSQLRSLLNGMQLRDRLQHLEQVAQEMSLQGMQMRRQLLGALAQAGGTIEVATGTLEQVVEKEAHLRWTWLPKAGDERTMVLTLVDGSQDESGILGDAQLVAAESEKFVTVSNDPSGDWEQLREAEFGKPRDDEERVGEAVV